MTFRKFSADSPEHTQALALRTAVLRAPLGLALSDADLAQEPHCLHIGGFDGEQLVAVLLLQPLDTHTAKMRQVAVQPELQGRGVGAQLIRFAETAAAAQGFTRLVAHARDTATEFYRKMGYWISDDLFLETTIPHRLVSKELTSSR